MAAQAAIEGRFLGGRPPYGYVIADAGPHPNPGKAAIGQRLHTLEPDLSAAPVVRRIYQEFIAGKGIYAIAEGLTAEDIPSPSAHDPARNRHRLGSGGAWSKHAVRVILLNPRYTGRQVWNRQRRDEVLIDVEDVALGHESKMRWNDETEWVWSQQPTHTPLVDLAEFEAAQDVFAAGQRAAIRKERTRHPYVLSGLMRCGLCQRKIRQLKECEAKLAKYRTLLEQQPDITIVGSWIAGVERERKRLERELGRKPTTNKLTTNEIRALVGRLREIVSVLAEASPQDKRAIYDELGVNLTYDPASKTVRAGAGDPGVLRVGVGGGT